MGVTTRAVILNCIAIVCFFVWFYCVYVTLREEMMNDKWTLIVGFGGTSVILRLIPLLLLCPVVRSIEYAEFWEIPEDDPELFRAKRDRKFYFQSPPEDDPELFGAIRDRKFCFQYPPNANWPNWVRPSLVDKTVVVGLAVFLYAWAFFSIINKSTTFCFVAIMSFTLEGFCTAELLKIAPTPGILTARFAGGGAVDFGLFKFVVGNAVCTAQYLYGFTSVQMWLVFVFCILLIFLHQGCPRSNYYIDDKDGNATSLFDNLNYLKKNHHRILV